MDRTEEWRTVADFPDYEVSSLGRIVRVRPDARNHRLTGRPLKQSPNDRGYFSVTLCDAGRMKSARVNRVVCEAFHGPAPTPEHHAAHLDGDARNNCASNLEWKVPVANEADKRLHGTARIGDRHWSKAMPERRAKGEGHGLAKLTEADVRNIRNDAREQREIAADYGVSQRTIWAVKAGQTWRHVA